MKKKRWLLFSGLNLLGCAFAAYGTAYSESAFVRWSWLAGFIFLLPGYIAAVAVNQAFWKWTMHIRYGYVCIFYLVALVTNALIWMGTAII
jgi:hypothetical protein